MLHFFKKKLLEIFSMTNHSLADEIKQSIAQEKIYPAHEHQLDEPYLIVHESPHVSGEAELVGAKNAVLVMIASLLLTEGKSVLYNVPCSYDVLQMITLLEDLGAVVLFDKEAHRLEVDTTGVNTFHVRPEIMKKMRASILVAGPLLARFGRAEIATPGGCVIGSRPIDLHLKNFAKMGVEVVYDKEFVSVKVERRTHANTLILDYPSVGATENLMMLAAVTQGTTTIINAAIEPEVYDLIRLLTKMGASIEVHAPATIRIHGTEKLSPAEHTVMPDRLEAGALLLAAAITGGSIHLPQARAEDLDVFLLKLEEMGHTITKGVDCGVSLQATHEPRAVSFKTSPYPGFPTDLQAPIMAALCLAQGTSVVHETVFENRLVHVRELQKMGAQITVEGDRAIIKGVDRLYGAPVIASDIRASCALVLAGFAAHGTTIVTGINHWRRGYDKLENKLASVGGKIVLKTTC